METKEKLRALRAEWGETKKAGVLAIGINEHHDQYFESGTPLPTLENFYAMADHFGVSMDNLAGRTDRLEVVQ